MDRASLKKRLAIEEGDRLAAYLDSMGLLTVGIGHNCVVKPVSGVMKVGDRITPEQEQELFDADVDEAVAELDAHLPWWSALDDARQNVMIDMAFNMGIKTLMTFNHTLAHIEAGEYDDAADGMAASRWAREVKGRAVFLVSAMRTGVYA